MRNTADVVREFKSFAMVSDLSYISKHRDHPERVRISIVGCSICTSGALRYRFKGLLEAPIEP